MPLLGVFDPVGSGPVDRSGVRSDGEQEFGPMIVAWVGWAVAGAFPVGGIRVSLAGIELDGQGLKEQQNAQ
jgi:hypothetical protein